MSEKSKGLSEAPLPPLAKASSLPVAQIADLRVPPVDKVEPKHHDGHRDRLRQRFAQAGPVAVADYELLELLLFRTIARRDVKPIAKALLKRFGGLSDVLNAPLALLQEVEGVGRSTALDFHIVSAVNQRAMRDQIRGREIMSSWTAVIDYCHSSMAYETREQFRILFLDKRNALIADEVQQTGTVDHTPVYPREIIRRAIELSSTAIILVHNHPSGDPKPSRSDIDVTQTIVATAKSLGISVYDHIIIGRNGHTSFKALGLI